MRIEDFEDHFTEAQTALLLRSVACNPSNREGYKIKAKAQTAALKEASRLMQSNEHLEMIEAVLSDSIFATVMNYVASFIPTGEDDDTRAAFENIASNVFERHVVADDDYFERLDAALHDFLAKDMALW